MLQITSPWNLSNSPGNGNDIVIEPPGKINKLAMFICHYYPREVTMTTGLILGILLHFT